MKIQTQIATSIFKRFFERYKNEILDDETEFIPMVKDILDGVLEVSENPEIIKNEVIDFIQILYISNWDKNKQDEAKREFKKLLKTISYKA